MYDYGDEHIFEIQLLGASPEPATSRSLRLVETHGTMPPQYGAWEEEEDDEGDDEWEEEEDEWEEDDDEED